MAVAVPDRILELLRGSLRPAAQDWPLNLRVRLGELRPAFLPKGRAGHGYRCVARNGRVLLASDRPLEALAGRVTSLRLQTWHRRILPGDAPEPYGVLVYVRSQERPDPVPVYQGTLLRSAEGAFDLGLEVGARLVLGFCRAP